MMQMEDHRRPVLNADEDSDDEMGWDGSWWKAGERLTEYHMGWALRGCVSRCQRSRSRASPRERSILCGELRYTVAAGQY